MTTNDYSRRTVSDGSGVPSLSGDFFRRLNQSIAPPAIHANLYFDPPKLPNLAENTNHGLRGLHGLKIHPRWLLYVREIRGISGSFRFGCGSAALCSFAVLHCMDAVQPIRETQ
jgi:hypothetical protein